MQGGGAGAVTPRWLAGRRRDARPQQQRWAFMRRPRTFSTAARGCLPKISQGARQVSRFIKVRVTIISFVTDG